MTLKELKIGQSALIKAVGGTGALRQHFLDMGVIPGAEVTVDALIKSIHPHDVYPITSTPSSLIAFETCVK